MPQLDGPGQKVLVDLLAGHLKPSQLHDALLHAGLGNLSDLAKTGNMPEMTSEVVQALSSRYRIIELVEGALNGVFLKGDCPPIEDWLAANRDELQRRKNTFKNGNASDRVSASDWPKLSYYEVDRVNQMEKLNERIQSISDRPIVAVWCGDHLARHDILNKRIKVWQPKIGKQALSPVRQPPRQRGDDVLAYLQGICSSMLEEKTGVAGNLDRLLVSQDFSNQWLTLHVELEWNQQTITQIQAVANWCQQLGTLAPDRRFVVAVAVNVSCESWSLWSFWKSNKTRVQDMYDTLGTHLASYPAVVMLEPLGDISLEHLKRWKKWMDALYGERDDDQFGETKLMQIVPTQTSKPMSHVAGELEKLFTSKNTAGTTP